MDRRSFITSLFGGIAVAGIGGTAMAKSLNEVATKPAGPVAHDIDPALKAGLDQTDAEFSQYHRRPYPRHHRRPPPPPVHHRRPRRVVRNGRVYYVR